MVSTIRYHILRCVRIEGGRTDRAASDLPPLLEGVPRGAFFLEYRTNKVQLDVCVQE